eukprot:gene20638-biopygen2591
MYFLPLRLEAGLVLRRGGDGLRVYLRCLPVAELRLESGIFANLAADCYLVEGWRSGPRPLVPPAGGDSGGPRGFGDPRTMDGWMARSAPLFCRLRDEGNTPYTFKKETTEKTRRGRHGGGQLRKRHGGETGVKNTAETTQTAKKTRRGNPAENGENTRRGKTLFVHPPLLAAVVAWQYPGSGCWRPCTLPPWTWSGIRGRAIPPRALPSWHVGVAADFKRVVPWRSLAWLCQGGEHPDDVLPAPGGRRVFRLGHVGDACGAPPSGQLFMEGGCECGGASFTAAQRLWSGTNTTTGWVREGRFLDWVARIGNSRSGPNDAAMIQRVIAHRDARVAPGDGGLHGGARLRGRGQEGAVCRVTAHPRLGRTVAGEPVLHARLR